MKLTKDEVVAKLTEYHDDVQTEAQLAELEPIIEALRRKNPLVYELLRPHWEETVRRIRGRS